MEENATMGWSDATANTTTSSRQLSSFYPVIVAEMVISCLCLALSLAVYATMPEFRNVHGRNLTSMSSCLLVTFLMLILDLCVRGRVSFAACFAIALIIHLSFVATFFWTSVMAFDIWRSLTRLAPSASSWSGKYSRYSVYAWTATLLTALPAAVLELTEWAPLEMRPQFGVRRCWLSTKTSFLLYFNLPVGCILLFNLILFLMTIRKLIIIKKMTAILQVKQQQKRLYLYLKLFLVMGITWFSEFLPWLTGVYALYAVAGMLTALHGLFLFCIFTGKREMLSRFCQQMGGLSSPPTTSQDASSHKARRLQNLNDSRF